MNINIEKEHTLQPLIRTVCHGVIVQYLSLKPESKHLILKIYMDNNKMCINVSNQQHFELELRVTYNSKLEEITRNVYIG